MEMPKAQAGTVLTLLFLAWAFIIPGFPHKLET